MQIVMRMQWVDLPTNTDGMRWMCNGTAWISKNVFPQKPARLLNRSYGRIRELRTIKMMTIFMECRIMDMISDLKLAEIK